MTRRMVLGQRSNGNFGLFVSRSGYDAHTSSDDDLKFSTVFNHARKFATGQILVPADGSETGTEYFPRPVDSPPMVICGRGYHRPAYAPVMTRLISENGLWVGFTARALFTGALTIFSPYTGSGLNTYWVFLSKTRT